MLWDESEDDLILGSAVKIGVGTTTPYETFDMGQTTNLGVGTEITYGTHANATFQGYINFHGYQGSNAQYRQLGIYDGKQGLICQFGYGGNPYVGIGQAAPVAELGIEAAADPWMHIVDTGTATELFGVDGTAVYVASDAKPMYFKTGCTWNAHPGTSGTVALEITTAALLSSVPTYNNTTAAAADMHVASTGLFYRSTSSARYKTQVEDVVDSYADDILNLRPVWYRSLCADDRSDWSHYGFIAEEVAEIDPRLVFYGYTYETDSSGAIVYDSEPVLDDDGNQTYKQIEGVDENGDPTFTDGDAITRKTDPRIASLDSDGNPVLRPDGVQYDRIVPLLINIIKRQDTRIAALEAAA
jgi:hypothetical protein